MLNVFCQYAERIMLNILLFAFLLNLFFVFIMSKSDLKIVSFFASQPCNIKLVLLLHILLDLYCRRLLNI